MKFGVLKSIGHNVADSLASGIGLMIGVYEMDIFNEAGQSAEGHITVDFLSGKAVAGTPSKSLSRAIELYREALPELCEKHGAKAADFKTLTARFGSDLVQRRHFIVTVEDQKGRLSVDTYFGSPGRRPRTHP